MTESQYRASEIPSSDPHSKRVSTKTRVKFLSYLYRFTRTDKEFEDAYRRLVDADELVMYHLCGCGCNSYGGDACFEPT